MPAQQIRQRPSPGFLGLSFIGTGMAQGSLGFLGFRDQVVAGFRAMVDLAGGLPGSQRVAVPALLQVAGKSCVRFKKSLQAKAHVSTPTSMAAPCSVNTEPSDRISNPN